MPATVDSSNFLFAKTGNEKPHPRRYDGGGKFDATCPDTRREVGKTVAASAY